MSVWFSCLVIHTQTPVAWGQFDAPICWQLHVVLHKTGKPNNITHLHTHTHTHTRTHTHTHTVHAQITPQHRIINLTVGQAYTIRCTAVGIPRPTVRFLEGKSNLQFRYHEEEDDTITSEYVLHDVKRSDAGIYYCFAHNILVNPPDGKRVVSDVKDITVTVQGEECFACKRERTRYLSLHVGRTWPSESQAECFVYWLCGCFHNSCKTIFHCCSIQQLSIKIALVHIVQASG